MLELGPEAEFCGLVLAIGSPWPCQRGLGHKHQATILADWPAVSLHNATSVTIIVLIQPLADIRNKASTYVTGNSWNQGFREVTCEFV